MRSITPVVFLVTAPELRHIIEDSGAVAVVTTRGDRAEGDGRAGGPAAAGLRSRRRTSPSWKRTSRAASIDRPWRDDLAALLYTGGTTGRSKGVALSHANLSSAGAYSRTVSHVPGVVRGITALAAVALVRAAGDGRRSAHAGADRLGPAALVRAESSSWPGGRAPCADDAGGAVDAGDPARPAARGRTTSASCASSTPARRRCPRRSRPSSSAASRPPRSLKATGVRRPAASSPAPRRWRRAVARSASRCRG